jgi:hypothetical protein
MPWLCLTQLQDGNIQDYKTVPNINNNNINNKPSNDTLLIGGGISNNNNNNNNNNNTVQHPLSLTPLHTQQVNNNKTDNEIIDERDIIIQSINNVFTGDTDGAYRKRRKIENHNNNIQFISCHNSN